MILVGDLGGTKVTLATFSAELGPTHPLDERTFPSQSYASFEAVIAEYLGGLAHPIDLACFGVAGPVVKGDVRLTNLDWHVRSESLVQAFGFRDVRLLNDLEAIANSVPILDEQDLFCLNEGRGDPTGAIAVIAPGTGLGEAYLTWEPDGYRAHPTEGGHTDFGPSSPLELDILRHMKQRFEHVSIERLCSGLGIPNLYQALKYLGEAGEPSWMVERLAQADDPTPVIVGAALAGEPPCELCLKTLDLFISILASEAGNLALKVLSTGGVFLGGGIPPKILPRLTPERFMESFTSKGRMAPMLAKMPVSVILNVKAPLLGAACYSMTRM
jgi:glucokinase